MQLKNYQSAKTSCIILCAILMSCLFFYPSCTKIDIEHQELISSTGKPYFFRLQPGTNPIVQETVKELEKQYSEKEFVRAFAFNRGYAIWKNAKINLPNHENNFSRVTPSGDTVIMVPLVLPNATMINGFLEVIKNGTSIQVYSFLRSDYANFSFGSITDTGFNAEKFQIEIMLMDKEVFGYSVFNVIDKRLFLHPNDNFTIDTTNQESKIEISRGSEVNSIFICETIYCLMNPCHYTFCVDYDPGGPGSGGPLPPINSPGGGGSGGGGGGGGTVPQNPCNPNLPIPFTNPSIPGNPLGFGPNGPLPPCQPPQVPPDPCNLTINSLKTNQTFIDKFNGLKDNTPNPDNFETVEFIYDLNTPSLYIHGSGTPQYPGISFVGLGVHNAIIHRHYERLNDMFSPVDIWYMMLQIVQNKATVPNEYFWAMIGPNETPYIMKVKDASKLIAYIQNHNFDDFNEKYKSKFNNPFSSPGNLDNKENEIEFLKMLKKELLFDAIELYRGNSSFDNWEKLNTNNGIVFKVICQ